MNTKGCPYSAVEEIDLMDPVVQENWFEAYDIIREESPAYYMEQLGMYVVTRYLDIEQVLRQPLLFTGGSDLDDSAPLIVHESSRKRYEEKGWPRYTPLGENLPRHTHYRALVDPALTAARVQEKELFIRGAINELIDKWIDDGEVPFYDQFAEPLPMIVIAELLGLPRMDLPQLKIWSGAWVLPFSRGLTEAQELDAVELHIELQHYIYDAMQAKRTNPGDDIITRLTKIEIEDEDTDQKRPLLDEEIIGITDHLLIGGNETTAFALSNGLWVLFQNPDTYQSLQQDRSGIKNFVEEVLRIESPTQGLLRHVTEDTEIDGVPIPKGSTLAIRYGAGNRDPRRYPNPEKPDLTRKNAGRHLAFGIGEKVCPGATLSRLEQRWAWEILLERLHNMRPTPGKNQYSHRKGMWLRALDEIYLSFDKV